MAIATGFVFAGIAGSSFTLFTNARLRFESLSEEGTFVLPRAALLLLSGPQILLRNSWKAAVRDLRPRYWLVLSVLVASGWSFCTGLAILNFMAWL